MIEIVNPVGVSAAKRSALALRRFDNLAGLRVGLLDNNKPNADNFLRIVGALLLARHADISLLPKRKMTRMEADGLAELASSCDVVINAFAD
ncbi:MAG: hypothetical protein EXR70_24530 [Deltaproteobacteria bacterium]|nr:hypothetical protein [Deltaproteobacteria bacterium]